MPGPPTPCRLVVSRPPPDGLGDQYPITVSVDGKAVGQLAPGDRVGCELAPGRHRLHASNTLMRKALVFEGRPGEEARFVTRNRAGLGTTFFAAMGAGWLYVALERE